MKRTVIRPGAHDTRDLFVYAHIDSELVTERIRETVGSAAAVTEFCGTVTSSYKQLLPAYGGDWGAYVRGVGAKLSRDFSRSCLTTWSAGSQFAKDVCAVALRDRVDLEIDLARVPDAIVMLDGLYAPKQSGARPGDGKVYPDDGLLGVAAYALAAARGERTMVILHSAIQTPYASSSECAAFVRACVEDLLGVAMTEDTTLTPADMDDHEFTEAWVLGDLHVIAFSGAGAREHVAEAHLFDECLRRWVPWLGTREESPTDRATPLSLGELALELSMNELTSGVREDPPGSNFTKLDYWAGCTRVLRGREEPLKMTRGPWCAAAFQWATYEAARQLGLLAGVQQGDAWRSGAVPHGRRVSVAELQSDMTQRGLYRPASVVRSGAFTPVPGDAVFLDRPGGAGAGWGHVARFMHDNGDGTFLAVGANEGPTGSGDDAGDRWRVTRRSYADPLLRGFGSFSDGRAVGAPKELHASVRESLETSCQEWLSRDRGDVSSVAPG